MKSHTPCKLGLRGGPVLAPLTAWWHLRTVQGPWLRGILATRALRHWGSPLGSPQTHLILLLKVKLDLLKVMSLVNRQESLSWGIRNWALLPKQGRLASREVLRWGTFRVPPPDGEVSVHVPVSEPL